jgi:predicted  nucleic acid-binding Zn-ribbon protein
VSAVEPLLALQERDLALDRLHHQQATLPQRAHLTALRERLATLDQTRTARRAERDEVARGEQRLADEAQRLADQATAAEQRLYSGQVSSPRELQALQADVDQLRRHQRELEDRQLTAMEQREPLDEHLVTLDTDHEALEAETVATEHDLKLRELELNTAVETERSARDEVARAIDPGLVSEYERRRQRGNGVGAARLSGMTCQGCHLTIPATEVDQIRKQGEGALAFCDNCGCILVP